MAKANDAARARTMRLWQATGLAATAYLLVFGVGIVTSLQFVLLGPGPDSATPLTTAQLSTSLIVYACMVLVALGLAGGAVALLKSEGVTWQGWLGLRRPDMRGVEGVAAVFAAVFSVGLVSSYAVSLLNVGDEGLPSGLETGTPLQIVVSSLLVGVSEELLVLALPCLILRLVVPTERRGWFAVGVVMLVALRMAYHLYQGPSTIQHVPWAVATIWVFYTYGRVLALIVAHTLFDVLVFSVDGMGWTVWWLLVATPLVIWAVAKHVRGRSRRVFPLPDGQATS